MKFTIETVSKMTGIPAASLRNWEKRYGFPIPERSESGHRFYCPRDVDFLKKASAMIKGGNTLTEVGQAYRELLKTDHPQGTGTAGLSQPEIFEDVDFRVQLLYEALLKFDSGSVQMHFQILNAKLGPEQLFDRVFEVILRKLGRDWAQKKISVSQEHYASAFLRLKLSSFMAIDFPATQPFKIIAATLDGELHEGGLLLVSAHLKFKGFQVYYFGSGLPAVDLPVLCKDIKPSAVILSYSDMSRLQRDAKVLEKLSHPVVIGGLALTTSENGKNPLSQVHANLHFCEKTIGSAAAEFVEMICKRKK